MNSKFQFGLLIFLVVVAIIVVPVLAGTYVGPRPSQPSVSAKKPEDVSFSVVIGIMLIVGWLMMSALLLFYRTRLHQWPVVLGCISLVLGTDRFFRLFDKKKDRDDRTFHNLVRSGNPYASMVLLGTAILMFGGYMVSLSVIQRQPDKYSELATYFEGQEADKAADEVSATESEVTVELEKLITQETKDPTDEEVKGKISRLQRYFEGGAEDRLTRAGLRDVVSGGREEE